jgi:acylphosphatase
MALDLGTPQVITNTVNKVQVTGLVNNVEEGRIEIHYMTLLEDGTPYQRGQVILAEGFEAIKQSYADIDAKIAEGKTFEQASAEILYAKVLDTLGE